MRFGGRRRSRRPLCGPQGRMEPPSGGAAGRRPAGGIRRVVPLSPPDRPVRTLLHAACLARSLPAPARRSPGPPSGGGAGAGFAGGGMEAALRRDRRRRARSSERSDRRECSEAPRSWRSGPSVHWFRAKGNRVSWRPQGADKIGPTGPTAKRHAVGRDVLGKAGSVPGTPRAPVRTGRSGGDSHVPSTSAKRTTK